MSVETSDKTSKGLFLVGAGTKGRYEGPKGLNGRKTPVVVEGR